MKNGFTRHKPNLLCIVPPYPITVPPASPAALLGYFKAKGCNDFEFLDLRLWVPQSYAITYSPMGVFGESFIIDVPDLPLVLSLLNRFTVEWRDATAQGVCRRFAQAGHKHQVGRVHAGQHGSGNGGTTKTCRLRSGIFLALSRSMMKRFAR